MRKLKIRSVSEHARITKGIRNRAYITKDEKDAQGISISSWTHFYHKPYANDWNEARDKAYKRKRRNTSDE